MPRALLIPLLLLAAAALPAAAQTDRMTLKSFATATGRLEAIDVPNREVVWRFENDFQMRFPFAEVRFILLGGGRAARVRTEGDTAAVVGMLTEFSPDGDLKIRSGGKTNLLRIVPRYTAIDFPPAEQLPASPGGR